MTFTKSFEVSAKEISEKLVISCAITLMKQLFVSFGFPVPLKRREVTRTESSLTQSLTVLSVLALLQEAQETNSFHFYSKIYTQFVKSRHPFTHFESQNYRH